VLEDREKNADTILPYHKFMAIPEPDRRALFEKWRNCYGYSEIVAQDGWNNDRYYYLVKFYELPKVTPGRKAQGPKRIRHNKTKAFAIFYEGSMNAQTLHTWLIKNAAMVEGVGAEYKVSLSIKEVVKA
jgi:hypothetical protein